MSFISKTEAQKRADQVKSFQSELGHLEADAVLSLNDEQKKAIHQYHEALLSS